MRDNGRKPLVVLRLDDFAALGRLLADVVREEVPKADHYRPGGSPYRKDHALRAHGDKRYTSS
jgi:hypothetical protein